VFDGKNPPYKIDDATNPLNKYGISKLNGERVTIKDSDGKLIKNKAYIKFINLKKISF
jgi:dTDP-4-dehydrorhamnose reductase